MGGNGKYEMGNGLILLIQSNQRSAETKLKVVSKVVWK